LPCVEVKKSKWLPRTQPEWYANVYMSVRQSSCQSNFHLISY